MTFLNGCFHSGRTEVKSLPINRRVPAEWEMQSNIWLAWPHQQNTWPGRFEMIPDLFLTWIDCLRESTIVKVLAGGANLSECERQIGGRSGVDIIDIETNDCWIRDYGPTFVEIAGSNTLTGIDWKYNAWGGKYPPWDADDLVASTLCSVQQIQTEQSSLCVEGGAMEFDGTGRLLSTQSCLMSPQRNPGWSLQKVEKELKKRTGVHEILWVDGGGLCGDDTDGHIDQLVRFIDPKNIVVATCLDPHDKNYPGLERNYQLVERWAASTTPTVTAHRLPIPPARFIQETRLPESYCNFLRLGPSRLLVPAFGSKSDQYAKSLLSELSQVDVEMLDCRDLIWGLGALHCASRDQPAIC